MLVYTKEMAGIIRYLIEELILGYTKLYVLYEVVFIYKTDVSLY